MPVSIFDLFSIGVGPSSSSGWADACGGSLCRKSEPRRSTPRDDAGSLRAVRFPGRNRTWPWQLQRCVVGAGRRGPRNRRHQHGPLRADEIRRTGQLRLSGTHEVSFDAEEDLILYRRAFSARPSQSRMTSTAYRDGEVLLSHLLRSAADSSWTTTALGTRNSCRTRRRFHIRSAPAPNSGLLCDANLSVSQVMLANECVRRSEAEVRAGLLKIWSVMTECVHHGCSTAGVLPGGLKVRRSGCRSVSAARFDENGDQNDPLVAMDWVTLWALAVNEENAAGRPVVTAPDQRRRRHHPGSSALRGEIRAWDR